MHDADSSYTTSKVFSAFIFPPAFNRIPKKWNSYGEPGIRELFIITNGIDGRLLKGSEMRSRALSSFKVFVLNVNNRS